jgi:hypothetical protein
MEGDATALLLVAGGWRLDRIPALRLAESAHAKRVKLCVQECVGGATKCRNVWHLPQLAQRWAQLPCYAYILGVSFWGVLVREQGGHT